MALGYAAPGMKRPSTSVINTNVGMAMSEQLEVDNI